jgi:hypothetical protein
MAWARASLLGAVFEDFITPGATTPAETPRPKETRFERLYMVLISLHGLVRGERMELGRDSDTGGQVGAAQHAPPVWHLWGPRFEVPIWSAGLACRPQNLLVLLKSTMAHQLPTVSQAALPCWVLRLASA